MIARENYVGTETEVLCCSKSHELPISGSYNLHNLCRMRLAVQEIEYCNHEEQGEENFSFNFSMVKHDTDEEEVKNISFK
jgi:hypothetical protein